MRLCEHLLKIKYWQAERERCCRVWKFGSAKFSLANSGRVGSKPKPEILFRRYFYIKQYSNGRNLFLDTSDLSETLIPEEPEFSLEQALDEDWFPWQPE